MKRDFYISSIFLLLLAALGVGSIVLERRATGGVVEAATDQAPRVLKSIRSGRSRCRTDWSLGQTIGVCGRCAGPRLDHSSRRLARSQRGARDDESADREMLRAGSAGSRVRSAGQPGRALGRQGTRLRLAGVEPRHHGRLQRQRLDRRQRPGPGAWRGSRARRRAAARPSHDESQAGGTQGYFNDSMVLKFTQGRKVPDADRQARPEQGQQRRREPPAAGQDVRGQDGQRSVRRRRIRQPSRDRVRRGHRQVQAALGRLRQQARRCQPRPVRSEGSSRAAVPQSGPLRRSLGRSPALRLRPRQRSDPGLQDRWDFREGSVHQQGDAGSGSVWDIAFSKDPQQKYLYVADGENRQGPHPRSQLARAC